MAISNIGVGSGLPLDTLLTNLRESENVALSLIASREKTVISRQSAYGTIKASIEALQKASEVLGKADAFGALKTSASGQAFTAAASSKAIAGQYQIEVQELATAQSLTTLGRPDRSEKLATGTGAVNIEIKLAGQDDPKTLTLDAADTSLEGIAKAINSDSSMDVRATLINDGTDSYLVLTAKGTGQAASVESITATDLGVQDAIGFTTTDPSNFRDVSAAQNAEVLINGIFVTSQTNTIENAVEGVTLSLTKTNTAGSPDTLSITRDNEVTSKAINEFVKTYNSLQSLIKTQTSFNAEDQSKSGALSGDSLARNVQNEIRDALNVVNSDGALHNLSSMGITTDPANGQLIVDSTKLQAALKNNMADVEKLFAGENGISKTLGTVADKFIKSDGIISSADDSMTRMLKDLERQYNSTADRIDATMETYRKQFTALDSMVAQMGSISTYLTQQLSMLGTTTSN